MKNSLKSCDSVDLKSCLNKKLIISTCVRRTVKLALNFYTYCTVASRYCAFDLATRIQRDCSENNAGAHFWLPYNICYTGAACPPWRARPCRTSSTSTPSMVSSRWRRPGDRILCRTFSSLALQVYSIHIIIIRWRRPGDRILSRTFSSLALQVGGSRKFRFRNFAKILWNFNFVFKNFLLVSRNFCETRNQNLDEISVISRNFLTKFSWFRETSTNFY